MRPDQLNSKSTCLEPWTSSVERLGIRYPSRQTGREKGAVASPNLSDPSYIIGTTPSWARGWRLTPKISASKRLRQENPSLDYTENSRPVKDRVRPWIKKEKKKEKKSTKQQPKREPPPKRGSSLFDNVVVKTDTHRYMCAGPEKNLRERHCFYLTLPTGAHIRPLII